MMNHRTLIKAAALAAAVTLAMNQPLRAEDMAKLAKDAGFQQATVIQTDGKPGPASSAVHVGTVKWFNESKGFGWISWEGGPNAWVHYRDIEGAGFKTLQEGQKVQFEIDPVRRGPKGGPLAIHVRAI
jgi:CspA family cold shock protein